MKTRQEVRKEIAVQLKKHGFSSKQVSITTERSCLDWCFTVYVNDPEVSKRQIRDIVKQFSRVERDEATNEIMMGGNIYVMVERSEKGGFGAAPKGWAEKFAKGEDIVVGHKRGDRSFLYSMTTHDGWGYTVEEIRGEKKTVVADNLRCDWAASAAWTRINDYELDKIYKEGK